MHAQIRLWAQHVQDDRVVHTHTIYANLQSSHNRSLCACSTTLTLLDRGFDLARRSCVTLKQQLVNLADPHGLKQLQMHSQLQLLHSCHCSCKMISLLCGESCMQVIDANTLHTGNKAANHHEQCKINCVSYSFMI